MHTARYQFEYGEPRLSYPGKDKVIWERKPHQFTSPPEWRDREIATFLSQGGQTFLGKHHARSFCQGTLKEIGEPGTYTKLPDPKLSRAHLRVVA